MIEQSLICALVSALVSTVVSGLTARKYLKGIESERDDSPPPSSPTPIADSIMEINSTLDPKAAQPAFPARKPWHIRKRELEKAHRTRRAKIESF